MVRRVIDVRYRRLLSVNNQAKKAEEKTTLHKRRIYWFTWSLTLALGLFVNTNQIMPSTYAYFQSTKQSQEMSIKTASIEQYLIVLPDKAKALTLTQSEPNEIQQTVATFSGNKKAKFRLWGISPRE